MKNRETLVIPELEELAQKKPRRLPQRPWSEREIQILIHYGLRVQLTILAEYLKRDRRRIGEMLIKLRKEGRLKDPRDTESGSGKF